MTADQSITGVLANYPLKFSGATLGVIVNPPAPVEVPVEGLPQTNFKEVRKKDGSREGAVRAVVDPPSGGSYLNIALYMKAPGDAQRQLIERKPVAPENQAKPVDFDVFQSLFNDGVHVFTYEVERTSGNSGPSTESWALYHRDLPGGNDVPGTGVHPDLVISLPPELGDPPRIGKDEVDKGVLVTLSYPFMKPYDTITLELNRVRFPYTVQPGQEDQEYEITVTRPMFELAGSNERFPISYTVVDQVNNPTHKRRWSEIIEADVNLERVTLTAPDLSENPNDPNDDPSTIDLGTVKDFLYALVHVFSPRWRVEDIVRVSYTCTPPAPGTAVTHSVEATVGRLPFTHKLEVPAAKVLVSSEVSVFYEQVRAGRVIAISTPATAQVIGEAISPFQLAFTNAPYEISAGGKLNAIHLLLTNDGTPVANTRIRLILPAGFTYADGTSGARDFNTDTGGAVSVTGVKGSQTVGTFDLRARSNGVPNARAQVTVVATGPVGNIALGRPQRAIAITPDGLRAYIGHDGSISVIDTTTNQLIHTITTSNTGFFAGIAATPDGAKIYAASTTPTQVLVIDTVSNRVVKQIPAGGRPSSITMSSDGGRLFIHNNSGTNGAVKVIDTRLDQVIKTFPTGAYTSGAAISPDGRRFYYCEYSSGSAGSKLVVIDPETGRRINSISVPKHRSGVALGANGTRIFLPPSNQSGAWLLESDAETLQPLRTISEVSGPNNYSWTFSPDGSRLYFCAYLPGRNLVLDIDSGVVIGTFETGSYPHGVACTPDGRLYVCNAGSNFVSVVTAI